MLDVGLQGLADARTARFDFRVVRSGRPGQGIQRACKALRVGQCVAHVQQGDAVRVEHAPVRQRPGGAGQLRLANDVIIAGQEHDARGLETTKKFHGRQRDLRGADRIAAGVQQRAAEKVGVAERQSQGDARAAGEAADIDTQRINAVSPHHVVRRQQCQGFAPAENVGVVAGPGRRDQDGVCPVEHRDPLRRHPRVVPGRHEHQQGVSTGRGRTGRYVQRKMLLRRIERPRAQGAGAARKALLDTQRIQRAQQPAQQLVVACERRLCAEHDIALQPGGRRHACLRARPAAGQKQCEARAERGSPVRGGITPWRAVRRCHRRFRRSSFLLSG